MIARYPATTLYITVVVTISLVLEVLQILGVIR